MATIVLHHELNEATYNCRKALNKAQEAINELHLLADYPTPTSLAEVTASNLVAFVEQRVNAIKNTPLYTAAERERLISNWHEWRIKAMPHVVAVEKFYNDWQEVSPVLDTATIAILTSDIAEALTPRFTVEIPLQAHRHKELISAVGKAVAELREWERHQDAKKIPLPKLLSLTDEELMQLWANGNIKVDHTHDDARLIVWRQANNDAIL